MRLDDASLRHLMEIGCFGIATYDQWKFARDWDKGESDACRRFVAPLKATASHARLYPSARFSESAAKNVDFLVPRKGYLEFDLTQECVRGHEEFWRAGARAGEYQRGTIVVVQPMKVHLAPQLKGCVLYGVSASRYQILKGSSAAAVRYAEAHGRKPERLFMFSASNGVEHVDLYPPKGREGAEYLLAFKSTTKPRWSDSA